MKLKNFPIILLIILFISACKKQDEADTQLPTVTFTGLALNDTLRNTVTAEIKGDDNSGKIGKMQVFANDSLIATATGENLSLNWNTLTVKDGTYTMKIVAIDHAGNKKEETTKVFVNNALIQLDADVVNSPFYETVDYIITDLEGNILNTLRSEKGTATGTVSINPKTAFEGDAIHLIRIEQNSFKQIQYFLSIKRGVHIKNNIQTGKDRFPTRNGPFSIKVNNLPEYDSFTVSSDRTSFTLPGDSYWSESMYSSPESKILVQVEKDGKGKYHIFDLLQGVKQITVDAALCTTNSLTKTIKLPFVVENAYIYTPMVSLNRVLASIILLQTRGLMATR